MITWLKHKLNTWLGQRAVIGPSLSNASHEYNLYCTITLTIEFRYVTAHLAIQRDFIKEINSHRLEILQELEKTVKQSLEFLVVDKILYFGSSGYFDKVISEQHIQSFVRKSVENNMKDPFIVILLRLADKSDLCIAINKEPHCATWKAVKMY